ncbi:MAG: undecaprenyldiphospho-muramoylpentapeptide beta-N-acetylglucosaminyltransferase [Erysipelotrichaceae bacterium]
MKVLITTGGTGGHIYPALSLAKFLELDREPHEVVFVGNHDRMEATLIPQRGYRFYGLQTKGLAGSLVDKLKALALLPKAYWQARAIIKKEGIDLCIGFGGYVSTPVLLAAQHVGCKTIIHEQNSIFGKANQAVAANADRIVVCYDGVASQYGDKVVSLGNPRASEVATYHFDAAAFERLHLDQSKKVILIVMGSLGSSSVAKIMSESLEDLATDYNVVFVSGKAHYEQTKQLFANSSVVVVDYIDQLAILDKVDLLICRAGATTAAEICAKGVAALLIPSPYVANNHQYYNALALYEQQACEMLEEKAVNKQALEAKVRGILENEQLHASLCAHAFALGKPDSAQALIALMKKVVRE